ncbi:MAG: hypothetical protein R3A48_03915 [Polyangiales bacterium]
MLAAIDEGRAPGDALRSFALATLAASTPGTRVWLRAAELLETHPQRLRRAVLLAGEVVEMMDAQSSSGPRSEREDKEE